MAFSDPVSESGSRAVVDDVPAPQLEAGTVLVAVTHSCISIGTELSGLKGVAHMLGVHRLRQALPDARSAPHD